MDWKAEAKKELRNYPAMKAAGDNISMRLQAIRAEKTSLRSTVDATPVQGGGNHYEDRLLNLITEEDRLKLTHKATRIRLALIERGLSVLSESERAVVETFAEYKAGEAVDILAGRLNLERAQIYRIWDAALYRYTLAEYGITEF